MNCLNCGKVNDQHVKFCKYCGNAFADVKEEVPEEIVSKPKKKIINLIFIYILMFFAIAEAVFIFLLLKNNNMRQNTNNKTECAVCETRPASVVNIFGGELDVPSGITYDFQLGKLLLEKKGYWGAVVGGVTYPYKKYANDKDKITKDIKRMGYQISNPREENILGKDRLLFDIEFGLKKTTLIYTTLADNSVLIVEFINYENGDYGENINNLLLILDEIKSVDIEIEFKRSEIINKIIGN